MRAGVAGLIGVLLLTPSATCGADVGDSAPPVVDQILTHAAALDLSNAQVQALEVISDRRAHSLDALTQRLQAVEAQSTAEAQQDALTLMQEIGSLRVMSGREALELLTPAQRRQWVELQQRTPTRVR